MSSKSVVMFGMTVGSLIGGYLPALWGGALFSYTAVITTAFGGLVGTYICYKLVMST